MNLFESLKKTFLKQPKDLVIANDKPIDKIRQDLTNDTGFNYFAFFDNNLGPNFGDRIARTANQATKIDLYRVTAQNDTVKTALKTIVNEVVYTENFKEPLSISVDIDSKKIEESIVNSFNKIMKLFNISKNIFKFVLDTYIDGQMNILLEYNEDSKKGIKSIYFLDPRFLTLDIETGKYKYINYYGENSRVFSGRALNPEEIQEYTTEEIVHTNFGYVSTEGIILSELEDNIKTANQLKTLEDLLIPLRFSRSISRRVFNVDVSELPGSKADAYLRNIANTFKYRKEYNTDTGEIKNQQHLTSMVEDYWIGSRGGQKGISVDLLNESGDLGQLEDIQYYKKKLYQGLGVPQNRILDEDSNQSLFDIQADQITNEDMQFFLKIRRIRNVYIEFFKEILKRELVSTGVLKETQFNEIKDSIDIVFPSENQFMERMRVTLFMKKVDTFNSCRELGGKILPVKMLYKTIFNFTDDEIDEIFKEIETESKDAKFKGFYQVENEEY